MVHDRLGRVLLELRRDFRRWGLPGGHQELGDSSAETAIREVFEETGLRIARPQVFGIASDPKHETMQFPNGDRTQSVCDPVPRQEAARRAEVRSPRDAASSAGSLWTNCRRT